MHVRRHAGFMARGQAGRLGRISTRLGDASPLEQPADKDGVGPRPQGQLRDQEIFDGKRVVADQALRSQVGVSRRGLLADALERFLLSLLGDLLLELGQRTFLDSLVDGALIHADDSGDEPAQAAARSRARRDRHVDVMSRIGRQIDSPQLLRTVVTVSSDQSYEVAENV